MPKKKKEETPAATITPDQLAKILESVLLVLSHVQQIIAEKEQTVNMDPRHAFAQAITDHTKAFAAMSESIQKNIDLQGVMVANAINKNTELMEDYLQRTKTDKPKKPTKKPTKRKTQPKPKPKPKK